MSGNVEDSEEILKTLLQSIPLVRDKVITGVLSEEEFLKQMAVVPLVVGVVYEGMRAFSGDKDVQAKGYTTEMMFVVLVSIATGSGMINGTPALPTLRLVLDQIRGALKNTRSGTGHFWKFQLEAQVEERNGRAMWVQRWTTINNS